MADILCLVCNKNYDGTTHCSVTACRACAMFFKRSQTLKPIPPCIKGANNCKFDGPERIKCSFCRYQKCMKVGLKMQTTERGLKSLNKIRNQTDLINQTNCIMPFDLQFLIPDPMSTLKEYCYHYSVNANKVKDYELKLLEADGEKLIELPGNRQMGYISHARASRLREFGLSSLTILQNSFPAFTTMCAEEQDAITTILLFLSFDLHSSFQTWKTFNDVNTTKMICSEAMFADFEEMNAFLDDGSEKNPMDVKMISSFFSTCWLENLKATLRLMHRINITDIEYLAVCCLMVWEEDTFLHFPHLIKMAEIHRNIIYKELHHYYRNILHMDNYVERIINIKELIKHLKKNLQVMAESVDFLRTFNYYENNEDILEATEKVTKILELGSK